MRGFSRDFVLLWHGQVISQLGNQAFLIAAVHLALDATQSTTIVGLVMAASALPLVVIGPIGGAIADRHSRRGLIIATDLVRASTIAGFTALAWWRPGLATVHVAALMAVAACNGVMAAVFTPAVQAIVPDLVAADRLARANALTQFSNQAAVLVGQAIGGVLYVQLGATRLLAFDALSFAYAALATWFVSAGSVRASQTMAVSDRARRYLAETAEGLAYVRAQPGMLGLLLTFAAVNMLFMPVFVLLPLYVRTSLGADAGWYGFLLAASGGGALGGSAMAGFVLTPRRMTGRMLALCIAAIGGAVLLLSSTNATAMALAAFGIVGVCSAFINVLVITLFQTAVRPELRGRVMALVVALSTAATPLGMAIGGLMGDLWGRSLRQVFAACGVAMLLVALHAASTRIWRSSTQYR